jgi:uncharacterized protein YndB with AHSA1/START domain
MSEHAETTDDRSLTLSLTLEAPRQNVWRCWTEPALLTQWFTPKPWTTTSAEVDVRQGGANRFVMRSPEGEETPLRGVYLEVVAGERLVFTDAFTEAWLPSEKPFMVAEVVMSDAGKGRTHYTATARHWSAEDRAEHEKMGFHDGWSAAARQLEALAKTL